MSSADVDKTLDLDTRMKSSEVVRPASTVDSCDSLEPKAKGKRKRETGEEDKLDAEVDVPILRSDCDKTEHKGDSQTTQATKRVRQDDVVCTDQADTPTPVKALKDDEHEADQRVLNQGLDGTSSQDHAASGVPDRAMPETLQKGTVDGSAADLHQLCREVTQPTGQLPTPTQIDAFMNEALQISMSGPAQLPRMPGLPGLPLAYHGRNNIPGLGRSAMSDLGHASMMSGFPPDLQSFLSGLDNDKFLPSLMQGHGMPEASTSAPSVLEYDLFRDLMSETGKSAIADMSPSMIPGYPSGTLPYSGLNNDLFLPDLVQDHGQPEASTSATKLPSIPFDIERDLIINPTSEGTSARTAPAPTGNSSEIGGRQQEANMPTHHSREQSRQVGEMTSSAMDELQRSLSGSYREFAFPPRPPLSNMGHKFFGQLHATGGLTPMVSSASASNLGQGANIDQGNTLHSGIPPDHLGGVAGLSSSEAQMYHAESVVMQQEIERLEAEVARSRIRLENMARNYPNVPFGISGSAPAGPTSDNQSSDTYIGKGKGRAV